MSVQLLISTTDGRFFNRNYIPPFKHFLIINQIESQTDAIKRDHVLNYQQKGLSKSRNQALTKAVADICLISDDDIVFLPQAEQNILQAFKDNPLADIITFQAQTPEGGFFKSYPMNKKWHTGRSLMRVTSFEIAFRRPVVLSAGLVFDERFGLGAKFATGEENIFLLDALNQGLKILYMPIPIVIHPKQSSGADFDSAELIAAKGAMFYRMFATWAYLIAPLFALKKYALSSRFGLWKFYRLMLAGIHRYKAP